MAENEIEISELELADELLKDMVFPVETATDTKAATLLQLKKWLGIALPVGFILPAIGKISDSRFTLLDGKTIAKNGAYREFCEKVVEQVQAGNWFACSQEEYDADLLTYGQCGRFVVGNDYIRIPKLTKFIGATVTLSEIGKSFAQSLPQHTHTRGSMNITGGPIHISAYGPGNITSGAFKTVETGSSHNDSGGTGVDISFNASNAWTGSTSGASDGTYKSGAKVQPDHVKFPYYMVIGSEGQREDIAVDFNKINEDLNRKADLNFENIESNSISLSRISREVTKCLPRIHQDIKIELNDGTLILKEGSKVYVPNGFEADGTTPKFDVVVIASDIVCDGYQTAGRRLMMYNKNNVYGGVDTFVYSGDTSTMASKTPYTYAYFYNTQTNKIYNGNGSSWVVGSFSLPLVIATGNSSSQYTSIDTTFNGVGYIGSTLFLLPGVKGLYPNGRNADGTLNNIEIITTKVTTITNPFGARANANSVMALVINGTVNVMHRYIESTTAPTTTYTSWFNPITNKILYAGSTAGVWSEQPSMPVASLDWEFVENPRTNTFTSLKAKLPFQAVDYNDAIKYSDKAEVVGWGIPDYSATVTVSSPYTAPSAGIIAWNNMASSNCTINNNTFYIGGNDASNEGPVVLPLSKGDKISFSKDSGTPCFTPFKGVK